MRVAHFIRQDVLQDRVQSVTVTEPGRGYRRPPTVTFSPDRAGNRATGTATMQYQNVGSVTITNGGSGYPSAPTVTFSAPTSGTTATGTAKLAEGGFDQYGNLYWARRTLDGKQLRVQVVEG